MCVTNKNSSREKIIMILFDLACCLKQNGRYFWFPWMHFNEKKRFGNVMSCIFYDKNFTTKFYEFHYQICSKVEICWKSAGYTKKSWITLKLQVICWDIYNFSERLRYRLSNELQKILKLALCKKICEEQSLEGSRNCP
jgi:hypothetical protein